MSPDGLLPVHKPAGPTSYDVIRAVKRRFGEGRYGHCGTLDPFAEGVLLVLLGKATKRQNEFMALEKTYRGIARLGKRSETGDPEGKTVETLPVPALTAEMLAETLRAFEGEQLQTPPMYSALKHQGKPLYRYARAGVAVERAPRPVTIHHLALLSFGSDFFEFRAVCSRGTYVRTLVEDIARKLGTCGMLESLVREGVGPYGLGDCVSLQTLTSGPEGELLSGLKPL